MKFSEAWLREWVDPGLDREQLLAQLTMAGLEVDGVEPVAGEFSGVVVGRVEGCDKHPDADKLSVCEVFDGEARVQVVCGAPNVRPGLTVAFARVGALLPDNFKIKKAKLRGVESHGMLCSAAELGLGDDHDGIMELAADAQPGADLVDQLQLADVTIDVDLTPNRGDCLSLKGLAREVGVLNSAPVTYPEIPPVAVQIEDTFEVQLAAPQGCPRYLGRVIRGIDLSCPTPLWMAERLRRCGLRSIDPVVDVTNYVLIELGQPMHAFDLNQIAAPIIVRQAEAGEQLTLLDGSEVALRPETLLITDANGPVAMAGVMGGVRSGVQPNTEDVFLECAYFAPLAVAGTARSYGLQTDAAHRYERGVDHGLQFDAIERATALLLDIVGGAPGPVVESVASEALPEANVVSLRQSRLHDLLGVEIDAATVDDAFARLDFAVLDKAVAQDTTWQIRAPSHRFDIAIEADLVEEICRIYGYNNVPSRQPHTALTLREVPLNARPEARLKRFLAGMGLQEVVTYSFVDAALLDLCDPGAQPLTLANPMSSDHATMRTNLLPGLIDAVRSNQARQQDRVALFELGLVFKPEPSGLQQPLMLGGVLWGRRSPEDWHTGNDLVDYFDVKAVVDALLAQSGVQAQFRRSEDSVMHPGQAADILVADRVVGRVGRIHPEVEANLDLQGAYVFEIAGDVVLGDAKPLHTGVSKYPSVRRDLAVVLARDVAAADVETAMTEALGEELTEFRVFDVYAGKGIDSNEKSLAIGLTLQSQTATLTEKDITRLADLALTTLEQKFGARLR
ncbi:MAG: phenylalanine--tRNA ligase subunit beta [Pseudomonadota bacterium]